MPELPEVETIKRDLNRMIVGAEIVDIETDSIKQVQPSLKTVKKAIVGATIKKVERRAKLLQIFLSNKKTLTVHLKMTGQLLLRKKGAPKDKYQHVVIRLKTNGGKRKTKELELRFCDLRKFGWVRLVSERELEKILKELGPEPLADLTLKKFKEIVASSRRSIKLLLLDQKNISGIGNIYVSDALWLAKIDPTKESKKLENEEIKKLFKAIEKVLKAGIKYRGASDQYYLDALGHKGSYQDHFLVYNRAGKNCRACKGKIKKMKVNGRGTYFCPTCQS